MSSFKTDELVPPCTQQQQDIEADIVKKLIFVNN